jgi:hypothetical protein
VSVCQSTPDADADAADDRDNNANEDLTAHEIAERLADLQSGRRCVYR